MNIANYTMHSGGALGSDMEWEQQARLQGLSKFRHYWHGSPTPGGNVKLTDAQLEEGWKRVLIANKTLKRKPDGYKSLLARNWFQVKNSQAVFAVGTMKNDTEVNGGTGWAVQMAIDDYTVVYVFDQELKRWYTFDFDKGKFVHCPIPLLTEHFAGIGTRELNSEGVKAIISIFKRALLQ